MGAEQHKVPLLTLAVVSGLSLIMTACGSGTVPVAAPATSYGLPSDGLAAAPGSVVHGPAVSEVPLALEQKRDSGTLRYLQSAVREQIESQGVVDRANGMAYPLSSFAKYLDATTPMPPHPENFAVVRIGGGDITRWQVVELGDQQAALTLVDGLNQFPKSQLLYEPGLLTRILAPANSATVIIEQVTPPNEGIITRNVAEQALAMYREQFSRQGALSFLEKQADATRMVGVGKFGAVLQLADGNGFGLVLKAPLMADIDTSGTVVTTRVYADLVRNLSRPMVLGTGPLVQGYAMLGADSASNVVMLPTGQPVAYGLELRVIPKVSTAPAMYDPQVVLAENQGALVRVVGKNPALEARLGGGGTSNFGLAFYAEFRAVATEAGLSLVNAVLPAVPLAAKPIAVAWDGFDPVITASGHSLTTKHTFDDTTFPERVSIGTQIASGDILVPDNVCLEALLPSHDFVWSLRSISNKEYKNFAYLIPVQTDFGLTAKPCGLDLQLKKTDPIDPNYVAVSLKTHEQGIANLYYVNRETGETIPYAPPNFKKSSFKPDEEILLRIPRDGKLVVQFVRDNGEVIQLAAGQIPKDTYFVQPGDATNDIVGQDAIFISLLGMRS